MRDIIIIPLSDEEEMVVATDNSGGIGTKEEDVVKVEDSLTAYFSARVALMEVLSVKAEPFSVIIHNFSGEDRWAEYEQGVKSALREAGLHKVSITGSTESNFPLKQSALGVSILGKRETSLEEPDVPGKYTYDVIGEPLTGKQVIERREKVAPLNLFIKCCDSVLIENIIPVGSKGVLEELKILSGNSSLTEEDVESEVCLTSSGGPSTCFIIKYEESSVRDIKDLTGEFFNHLTFKNQR